jgi:hypothetical protein
MYVIISSVPSAHALNAIFTSKCQYAVTFQLYDIRRKGYISQADLKTMLSASLKENDLHLSDSQLDKMVTDTFHTYDTNKDGYVNALDLTAACDDLRTSFSFHLQRAGLRRVPKHVRSATQRAEAIHPERHGHH